MGKSPSCGQCAREIPSDSKFCPHCGAVQKNSSKANADNAKSDPSELKKVAGVRKFQTVAPWAESTADSGKVKILGGVNQTNGSITSGTLVFQERKQFGRVHVFAKSVVKFGRSPEDCDVTLWVLPLEGENAKENQKQTNAISGLHFEIRLTNEGLHLVDLSRFGTILNGVKLQKGVPARIPVDCISKLDVFDSTSLRLTPMTGGTTRPNDDEYSGLGDISELALDALATGLGGLFVERLTNIETDEAYLLLFDRVCFGEMITGKKLPDETTDGAVSLLFRNNRLWIHNRHHEGQLELDSVVIGTGEAASLGFGAKISCGGETGLFTQVTQVGVS